MNNSILNIDISCFASCDAPIPQNVNLLTWLTSEKHRQKVENLRSVQDEALQIIIKKSLPAITPSGVFSYRDTEHLTEHSGFLVFDIDKKENLQISFDGLKEQISHIPNIAYCGLSCRGLGLWGLVPIPKSTPDEHKNRFAALLKDFKAFEINLDPSGSDVCRLRIYSWDADAYFNHNATIYNKLLRPQVKKSSRPIHSDTRERVEAIISQIKQDKTDITEGYDNWFLIASGLANEFCDSGRGYFHEVSKYHLKYSETETNTMFDNVLKKTYSKISIGSFFKIASDYGIRLKEKQIESEEVITQKPINTKKELSYNPVITLPKVEKRVKPGMWSNDIEELEKFFSIIKLPTEPIILNECIKVMDVSKFIECELSICKAQNGNKRFLPYLNRLRELKKILSN